MENLNLCPICQCKGSYSYQYNAVNTIFDKQPILSCSGCDFSWNNTISQKDLNKYYHFDYNNNDFDRSERFDSPKKYFSDESFMFKPYRSKLHLEIARRLISKKSQISILDCGAGLGTTLYLSKHYFKKPSLFAYENDQVSHKYLDHLKVSYFSGDPIESLNSFKKKFDLIILSHFLEHISPESIIDFVDLILDKLNRGGALIIEVPNDNWVKYEHLKSDMPPHVGFFSINSMKELFYNRAHVNLTGTIGKSIKKRNLFSKVSGKIYSRICKLIYKVPFTKDGDCLLICVSPYK